MPYIGVQLNYVMQVMEVSILCVVAFGAQAWSETWLLCVAADLSGAQFWMWLDCDY